MSQMKRQNAAYRNNPYFENLLPVETQLFQYGQFILEISAFPLDQICSCGYQRKTKQYYEHSGPETF